MPLVAQPGTQHVPKVIIANHSAQPINVYCILQVVGTFAGGGGSTLTRTDVVTLPPGGNSGPIGARNAVYPAPVGNDLNGGLIMPGGDGTGTLQGEIHVVTPSGGDTVYQTGVLDTVTVSNSGQVESGGGGGGLLAGLAALGGLLVVVAAATGE